MEYESVKQSAMRLGVSERAVQKWAAAGKIPGATKIGRSWFIPRNFNAPDVMGQLLNEDDAKSFRLPMPLLNGSFEAGKAMEYINSLPDEDDRNIALGEYYYFTGQAQKAADMMEVYLDSKDESLRYSAGLVSVFANLSLGHIHRTKFAINALREQLRKGLMQTASVQIHAMGVFTATAATVLLHTPPMNTPPLEDYTKYLPGGLKLYACYILAHKEYLLGNYERSLGIADMILALCPEDYPVAMIYVHIISAMDLMSLMRVDEAKKRLAKAWDIASKDGFIEPFGEHHGLLQGLIEVFFKKDHPEDYENIIKITYEFSAGWRKIHNPAMGADVADNLTTMEFTIAMLYNRGWTIKEISSHMDVSERTVKNHLSVIYEKLNITSRKELHQYMLR